MSRSREPDSGQVGLKSQNLDVFKREAKASRGQGGTAVLRRPIETRPVERKPVQNATKPPRPYVDRGVEQETAAKTLQRASLPVPCGGSLIRSLVVLFVRSGGSRAAHMLVKLGSPQRRQLENSAAAGVRLNKTNPPPARAPAGRSGVKWARTGSEQVHEQNLVFTRLSHSSGTSHLDAYPASQDPQATSLSRRRSPCGSGRWRS